ncbi:MAG: glutathione binding-like protein [Gammaproteobacteria bacterium]
MTAIRRSVMTLYSGLNCYRSHQVRLVLAEKGVTFDVLNVDMNNPPNDLLHLNPYTGVPTLVDRDLVLYNHYIIMEYLDERFPHPPLLPVYPVARAKNRLMMHRIEEDWFSLVNQIQTGNKDKAETSRKQLRENLIALAPAFADSPYFLSTELTLVDCTLLPLLWRLPSLGIDLPPSAKAIKEYGKRLFKREAFLVSLTDVEREMGEQRVK